MNNALSPKQQKMHRELLRIDKKAGEAYEGALKVLRSSENPDRFSQSAHSLREVTFIISRKVGIPQETKKENSLKGKLKKQFAERPDLLPSPAEEKTRALIKRWIEVHEFFTAVAHHGKDAGEEEFLAELSEFEAILLQFLKPVPETLEELDLLLNIQTPKQDDAKRLSETLKHPTHVEYFFLKLNSANWLIPLKEYGFFSKPPEGLVEGNYIMFPSWPLSKYLIKVAGQRPREVMDIIKSIKETGNFRIHADLIDCTLQMPSSIAKEVIPLAQKWTTTPYLSLIPEKLGELSIKLCQENAVESAIDLLEGLLDVRSQERENEVALEGAQPYFDSWMYEKILKEVVSVLLKTEPCKIIGILCSKLSRAIQLEISEASASYDLSYIWRPATESHPQNRDDEDVKNLLVTAIRDSMETIGKSNEEIFRKCLQSLSKFNYPIFRRIELHLMRLFSSLLKSETQGLLVQREVLEDVHLWHEYYHLLQEQYANLPQHIKEKILGLIEEGPNLERLESWYEEKKRSLTQEEKDAYKAHWQIRHLSAIKDVVPSEWKERWNELVSKYEEPQHLDFHYYMEPLRVGAVSPLPKEEIKKKSPQEVVNYLHTWKPSRDPFAPSREALSGILSEVVSEDPSNYAKICYEFKTLQHVYTYHLLEGFRKAVRKGNTFDWSPVIVLCRDVLATSESAEIQADEDRYYDLSTVKGAIADLLEEGLKNQTNSPSFELRQTVWQIIGFLLTDKEPDLAYEEKYVGENRDPFNLSLNTVRGKAMHVLIYYGLWCARCLDLSKKEDRMVPEVKEQLERMLDPEHEQTQTIRSVYGAYLPSLMYLDKAWIDEHISAIFPKDTRYRILWRAAWEAYVKYSYLNNAVYEKLRDQYKIAINKLDSPKLSEAAKEKLSQHLIIVYMKGLEELEDESLIERFFRKAQPEIRGHAIWFIGKQLMRFSEWELDKELKEKILKRIMSFWEWRIEETEKLNDESKKRSVQELKWFGFWFLHSPFDRAWTISQLRRTLELTEGVIEFPNDVVDNLQDYVKHHCLDTLKAFILLVKGNSQNWLLLRKERIEELTQMITKEHPLQEIKDLFNELIESLVKRGYHEFAKLFIK